MGRSAIRAVLPDGKVVGVGWAGSPSSRTSCARDPSRLAWVTGSGPGADLEACILVSRCQRTAQVHVCGEDREVWLGDESDRRDHNALSDESGPAVQVCEAESALCPCDASYALRSVHMLCTSRTRVARGVGMWHIPNDEFGRCLTCCRDSGCVRATRLPEITCGGGVRCLLAVGFMLDDDTGSPELHTKAFKGSSA